MNKYPLHYYPISWLLCVCPAFSQKKVKQPQFLNGAINVIRVTLFVFLLISFPVPVSAKVPPEAQMLELIFQEQEKKINDATFAKYKPELTKLMNECVRNEDFEQAKHIKDILERKVFPGMEKEKEDDYSHFIGQWEELAGGYVYLSRFDGKQAQQKSGNSEWKSKGGIDKDSSSSDIIRINETQAVWFYWIKADRDDRIFQVNHATKLVSLLKRKGGREKEAGNPAASSFPKFDLLSEKIHADMEVGKEKLARQYASALQKKSKEWGISGHLEAAIWARKRAQELQKENNKDSQQVQEIIGTWDFPSGTIRIKDPKEFRMEEENMTFEYIRSLNGSAHLFNIRETKRKKIVARVNNLLLIIPYDCRGPFREGTMKP